MSRSPRGLLVLNLGTPDSPDIPQVTRYLAEFLMDPYVIDIPRPLRWLLLHGVILRTRPAKSSAAYKSIWTTEGSPLLINTQKFASGLEPLVSDHFDSVMVGMRYGNPSIEAALEKMSTQGIKTVTVFSMYPQYAESSSKTGIEEVMRAVRKIGSSGGPTLEIEVVPPYFGAAEFVEPYVSLVKHSVEAAKASGSPSPYVLMSFHGLPQRHLTRLEIGNEKRCGKTSCCDRLEGFNANCYRAQSFETARRMAKSLGLDSGSWSISFQSRLGPGWIQPFTDIVLEELPKKGKKDLVVVCPSFTSDCLETLEEIGIRGKEIFMGAGGRSYHLVPCLNASPEWIAGASRLISSHIFSRPLMT